jgi:hypothetical protein
MKFTNERTWEKKTFGYNSSIPLGTTGLSGAGKCNTHQGEGSSAQNTSSKQGVEDVQERHPRPTGLKK